MAGVGVANHTSAAGGAGTSVLKSVDEILRSNGASHLHVPSSSVHGVIGSSDHLYNNHVSNQFGIGSSTSAMANNLTSIGSYGAGGLSSSIGVSGVPISHIGHGGITGASSGYGGDHRVMDFSPINSDMYDQRSHFRSSSADPTLNYGTGNSYMTTSGGIPATGGHTGIGITADPYGGGKYSKYGTMTGSSSLYRKY